MSAAWLLYALLVGAMLALGAYAAEALCRQLRLPTRWAWIAALATLFVLIALSVRTDRGGSLDLSALSARATTTAANTENGPTLLSSVTRTLALTGALTRGAIAAAVRRLPPWMSGGTSLLLGLGAILALTALASVHLRLRRARRRWPIVELHGATVRIAPSIGPAVVGVLRPEIVVPQWLMRRSAEEQRLVMEHEREHLRCGDHLLLGAATVAVALLPWHPAVWWMLARLRLAIELDCDARVLRRGVPARTYGTLLIDMAGQCSGFRVGATALADESSHLERRLLAMNDPRVKSSVLRVSALCAATALSLLAACEAKMPTSAEIQSMDVAAAERSASAGQVLPKRAPGNTIFYVNGTRTDERAAHALTPNQIASVTVTNSSNSTAPSEIRINTTGEPAVRSEEGHGSMMRRLHSVIGQPIPDEGRERQMIRVPQPESNKIMTGLLFVDGVRADEAVLRQLDPKTFQSVEVIKGTEAVKRYTDPKAVNGVIRITTKK